MEWIREIEAREPYLHAVLNTCMINSDKAYMAIRLLEMRRLLKPTGSIWLHCDPIMSHYLKLAMDAIFGRKMFKNEMVWKRNFSHNDPKVFGKVSDAILFYGHPGPWRYPEERMRELDANGRIHLPKKKHGMACFKRFLSDSKGQIPPNV